MNNYVYTIGNKLYINLTNKCTNKCEFCIRKGRDGMENTNLWLTREPTAEDVIEQLPSNLDEYDDEVVFCGFGEPTFNLQALEEVASFLHCVDKTTRINTNGQANLIHGEDVSSVVADSCDVVNISLNAPTAPKYDAVCHSVYGEKAFDALTEFASLCKSHGSKVVFSVVDTICKRDIDDCAAIAEKLGVAFRVRTKE
ncbi:MAG: TatD family nuclease-associated radical SAM protein [Corallococcus sp.]|nr:TatD family nuclease-associated radical SAM protein [Corallococcus sp.]